MSGTLIPVLSHHGVVKQLVSGLDRRPGQKLFVEKVRTSFSPSLAAPLAHVTVVGRSNTACLFDLYEVL